MQISCAVTVQLITAFVFATYTVQSLYFLNPKLQASSHLLWLYSPLCVGPVRKPQRRICSAAAQMNRVMRKPKFWFPTWSDTNLAVQLQKMARGLKFWIQKVEGLYYPCSENKGTYQLRGYSEADLRLCFSI